MSTPICPGWPPSDRVHSSDECEESGCPGWAWFDDKQIERCDSCRRWQADEDALQHVRDCGPCRAYLTEEGGILSIRGFAGWTWIEACGQGAIALHGRCGECIADRCFPDGVVTHEHLCADHGHESV